MTKKIDNSKLSMLTLVQVYRQAQANLKAAKAEADELKCEIERRIKPLANDYGTFERELDSVNLKLVVSKNIAWDSTKLQELYSQIDADGADPSVYIKKKVEYTVSENAYKEWSSELRDIFDPARTEKEPKITFEIME